MSTVTVHFNDGITQTINAAIEWKHEVKKGRPKQTIEELVETATIRYITDIMLSKQRILKNRKERKKPDVNARRCCNCVKLKDGELFIDRVKREPCCDCYYDKSKPSFKPKLKRTYASNGLTVSKIGTINSTLKHRGHE